MQTIGPGLYLDSDGSLHVYAAEICEALGWEDTPRHRQMALEGARAAIRDTLGELPTTVVD